MEKFYTSYERTIDGTTYYFVKQFKVFPEYKTVPPILETYGMHTNFCKACSIARIDDPEIQKNMADELGLFECYAAEPRAQLVSYKTKPAVYNVKFPEIRFSFLSRLLGLRTGRI